MKSYFSKPKLLSVGTLTALLFSFGQQPANAEMIVGLTVENSLISFDSGSPGAITNTASITGLLAGDTLVGIDRRPSLGPNNGVLYGVAVNSSGAGRLYTLNTLTGAATAGAALAANPADMDDPFPFTTVMGSAFGVDFNPTVDLLRVTSDTGQNLRINVDNGLTQLDGPLAYQAGDLSEGTIPVVVAVAYANSRGGAMTTMLRGVDTGKDPDLLTVFASANGGVLTTSTGLGVNSNSETSYDISGLSGVPFFSFTTNGTSSLYAGGPSGLSLLGEIGDGVPVRGIAANVGAPIPEPSTILLSAAGIVALVVFRRRRQKA